MVALETIVPAVLVILTDSVVPLTAVVDSVIQVQGTAVDLVVSDDLPVTLAGLVSVVLIDLATLETVISADVVTLTLGVPGALMIQAPPVMAGVLVVSALQIPATSVASRIPSDEWDRVFLYSSEPFFLTPVVSSFPEQTSSTSLCFRPDHK
jgi:hypothetical protein